MDPQLPELGELELGMSILTDEGNVILAFSRPIPSLSLVPDAAIEMAEAIIKAANSCKAVANN